MLTLYGKDFASRLLLGTAQYPSPESLKQAVKASGAEIVTVSLRRESARARTGQGFWALIEELGCKVLPNTAGCRTAKEAIATANMARELFGTDWIKLEVIGNDDTLQPDLFGLVEAATALAGEGFEILPYTTEDLSAAERLVAAGCTVLMPWAAPIGSARGLINTPHLRLSCQIQCNHDMTVKAISRLAGTGRPDAGKRPADQITPPPVRPSSRASGPTAKG